MRTHNKLYAILVAGSLLGVALTPRAAAVTDEEFEALKKMVQQLGDKVQKLEEVHGQDQKTHEQDQQQIQRLKQQVGETQKTASEAQQKADTVAQAQAARPMPGEGNATHNFTMVGDAEIQFGKTDGQHSGFGMVDFAPIFLYRARDNLLFEAGVDITLQNGTVGLLNPNQNNPNGANGNSGTTTTFDVSFAQLDFVYNDYVTFVGGDMLLPLGTYSERTAGWLNKIPDDPLPRDVLPGSGVGVQLRGGMPVGAPGQYISYSAFGVNGPSSVDGTGNATTTDADGNTIPNLDLGGNVGFNSNGDSIGNLHGAPSGGGRVAWFRPWKPHYDVELGLSGQAGTWDNSGNDLWAAGVVDAAVHVGPYVEVKGEYIYTWEQTADMGTLHPQGWWVQGGYKLAGLNTDVPLFNNLELMFRYDTVRDGLGDTVNRWTAGYVYYFSNNLLFEGDYEVVHSHNPDLAHNRLVFQLGYGF